MTPETNKFIKLLESELGYAEKSNGYTKFGKWYNSVDSRVDYTNQPWCDMYISWAAKKLGYEDWIGQFAWTPSHAQWFKKQGAWGTTPKPGALVFYDWSGSRKIGKIDHVGVVVRVEGKRIHTIEGNIDGGVAKRKVRDQRKVVGYGYPEEVKARLEQLDLSVVESALGPVADGRDTGTTVAGIPMPPATPETAPVPETPVLALDGQGSPVTDGDGTTLSPQTGDLLDTAGPPSSVLAQTRPGTAPAAGGGAGESTAAKPASGQDAGTAKPLTTTSPGKHRKPEAYNPREPAGTAEADSHDTTPVAADHEFPAPADLAGQALVGSLVLAAVAVFAHAKTRLRLAHAVRVPQARPATLRAQNTRAGRDRARRPVRAADAPAVSAPAPLCEPTLTGTRHADFSVPPTTTAAPLVNAAPVGAADKAAESVTLDLASTGRTAEGAAAAPAATSAPASFTWFTPKVQPTGAQPDATPQPTTPQESLLPYRGRRRRRERLAEDYGSFRAEAPLRGRRHRLSHTAPPDTRPTATSRGRRQSAVSQQSMPLAAPVHLQDDLTPHGFSTDAPLRGRRHRNTPTTAVFDAPATTEPGAASRTESRTESRRGNGRHRRTP
ncbi:CHAP domain-containing protein [Sinosporangium siamense]|uniref:Peptidase C51 domain-containing protein n=1 Tax=Sinosporangium siamense TaxID=1367973 RepID=A0A919V2D8_9ACTN|nr:CHAP domain-containing protein [Sinosporangium siamense]GII89805.1 hypothetical protein Ssi02_00360 [Sinosporangium siamense]